METLNSTEPHYIRCVKPNTLFKPAIFEYTNIMQQLRCGVSALTFSRSDLFYTLAKLTAAFCPLAGCFRGNSN